MSGTDLSFRNLEGVQLVARTSYDRAAQQARLARLEVTGARRQRRGSGRHRAECRCGHESVRRRPAQPSIWTCSCARSRCPTSPRPARAVASRRSWPGLEYERADVDAQLTLTPTRTTPSRNVLPVGGSLVAAARDQRVVLDIGSSARWGRHLLDASRSPIGASSVARVQLRASDVARVVPQCGIVSGPPSRHARRHAGRWRGPSRRRPRRRRHGAVR